MLTPVFECQQDDRFVLVKIYLSAICKVLEAVFDISGCQFTFYCRPYYLRLKFNEPLEEGKGERATYELETNTLTVYLPKAQEGQVFTQLDHLAYLIATDKQRAALGISVVDTVGASEAAADDGEEEEETEFVQSLQPPHGEAAVGTSAEGGPAVFYGFANHFSGVFRGVDEEIVREMIDVRDPEATSPAERRQRRLLQENNDFNEEALLIAFEDEDGDVAQALQYVPAHMRDFQRALQSEGVAFVSLPPSASASVMPPPTTANEDAFEEEETTLLPSTTGQVPIWRGNIADFTKPLIEEISSSPAETATDVTASTEEEKAEEASLPLSAKTPPGAARPRLAIPRQKPALLFTKEENEALIRMKLPRLLFPPSPAAVAALTADILFAEAYDDVFTQGTGCSESVWNLCKLSPALSFLDPADNVYEACVSFTRRLLVYPLLRHIAIAHRVLAVVGARLLLGKQYVLRALLRVRLVLSHSEHKHVLSTIFLDPLIGYWQSQPDADSRFTQMALEIHEHATRKETVTVQAKRATASSGGGEGPHGALVVQPKETVLQPLTLLFLGLPFSE